jgi:hypothetical protein
VGEHHPDAIERDGEEMVGEKAGRGRDAAGTWISAYRFRDIDWK